MPPFRPASLADADAVLALFARTDVAEFGSLQMDLAELTGPLSAADTDAVVVEDGGRVLGYAHLTADGEVETAAHPEQQGLQDDLLSWVVQRARERGTGRLEHWSGPRDDSPLHALLRRHGFTHARTVWHLARETGDVPAAPLPSGTRLRPFDRARDAGEVHALVQRAFAGSFGSHPRTFQEWSRLVLDQGADVLCLEQGGALVACATHFVRLGDGHVGQLAVDPGHRGRGLALALLHEAFRRDAAAGRPRTTLGVDGENAGARRLYDRAGMTVVQEFRRWERDA